MIIKTNLPRELVDHQNKLTERASRSSQQTYRESQSIITTNLPRQLVDHHNKLMDRVGRSSQQTYRESWSIITVSISFFFFFSASKSSCNRQKKLSLKYYQRYKVTQSLSWYLHIKLKLQAECTGSPCPRAHVRSKKNKTNPDENIGRTD